MRFRLALALAAFLCPLAAFEGVPIKISELTRRAQLIVRGKVQEKTIQRDSAGRIYTEIRLSVTESWKGDPKTSLLKLIQPGGTLGEQRDFALDDASYEINEEVVAFLVRNEKGDAVTVNSAQGKFRITKTEAASSAQKFSLVDLKRQIQEAAR